MEIFNLPNECKIDKNIPKEMIYKNAEANEKLKRVFIDTVEKIRFMYLLNFSNSNIQNYVSDKERFEEIDFIKMYSEYLWILFLIFCQYFGSSIGRAIIADHYFTRSMRLTENGIYLLMDIFLSIIRTQSYRIRCHFNCFLN